MAFTLNTLFDGSNTSIKEAAQEGSRTYTSGDNPTSSVHYIGSGYADTSAAYTAINTLLYTESPIAPFVRGTDSKPRFHGLPVTSITVTRRENVNIYDIVVNCSVPNFSNSAGTNGNPDSGISTNPDYTPPTVEDSQFSFAVSQQTAHVDFGLAIVGRARYDGGSPVAFSGIGPQDDGHFSGADMLVPSVQMTISRSEPKWYMTANRRLAIANLTGSINNASFAGFGAGNVMFAGLNTQKKWLEWNDSSGSHKDWYWTSQYVFNVRPSSQIVVGSTTLNIGGWDATSFEDTSYSVSALSETASVWSPQQVSVWRLYPPANFASLGLVFPS